MGVEISYLDFEELHSEKISIWTKIRKVAEVDTLYVLIEYVQNFRYLQNPPQL